MRHVHADESECKWAAATTVVVNAIRVNAKTATRAAAADDSVKRYANTEWKAAVTSFAPTRCDAVPVAYPPNIALPGSDATAVTAAVAATATAAITSEPAAPGATSGPGLGHPTAAECHDTHALARRAADVVCTATVKR